MTEEKGSGSDKKEALQAAKEHADDAQEAKKEESQGDAAAKDLKVAKEEVEKQNGGVKKTTEKIKDTKHELDKGEKVLQGEEAVTENGKVQKEPKPTTDSKVEEKGKTSITCQLNSH